MLRGSRNRSKQIQDVDKLMELMNSYKKSQLPYIKKMHKLIPIDETYFERLEGNFNNWGGLKYYNSFEEYLNVIVVPYLLQRNIKIGDLR